jgi:hypothetical protein
MTLAPLAPSLAREILNMTRIKALILDLHPDDPPTPAQLLLARAATLAEALHPGRVYTGPGSFYVMFGGVLGLGPGMGPGLASLGADISGGTLRLMPRCYSLGTEATLDLCEAQGLALVEAARLGRVLQALAPIV